jgi:hypothetical protein
VAAAGGDRDCGDVGVDDVGEGVQDLHDGGGLLPWPVQTQEGSVEGVISAYGATVRLLPDRLAGRSDRGGHRGRLLGAGEEMMAVLAIECATPGAGGDRGGGAVMVVP